MFGFFKKREVNSKEIRAFDSAIKAIKLFIVLSEWNKAKKAIKEIEYKEKESLSQALRQLDESDDLSNEDAEKEKIKLTDKFKDKLKDLTKIEIDLNKKEEAYKIKIEKERFKIRFNKIKNEIDSLLWNKQAEEALGLLKSFLNDYNDNYTVIKFFNKEKKRILKAKEEFLKDSEKRIKDNAKLEALSLIWNTVKIAESDTKKNKQKGFFWLMKEKLNFYKKIKEKIRKKKLLDEISLLIEEDSKVQNDIAARKLANIHKWLVKELSDNKMLWYNIYWKILWADKISGDTFGFKDSDDKYNFFLWDATGHGIRAWFIVTLVSRLFTKYVKTNPLQELAYKINNGLKQDLKTRNFITGIFFEIIKDNIPKINFVWMGHEPMFIYRANDHKIEKLIPGWLAAGIRLIKDVEDVKVKDIHLEDWDILLTYSDWVIESKNSEWEMYGSKRLEQCFMSVTNNVSKIENIYDYIVNDIKTFKGGSNFEDDLSILLLKRDSTRDLIDDSTKYLEEIQEREKLTSSDIRKLKWKTVKELDVEIKQLKKEKELQIIIKSLENLYYTWEILKLKQEAIRFIKDGYIDKRINAFLRKAIDNEKTYKIQQKSQKISNKYKILEELYKKWEYETVISEIEEVIAKDWNI